ncbi:MAG: hypothetical protein FWG52_00800 [Proteobacteria bacterium]|nr:hypothetical protein [Pseudomonadota bacterium]
MPFIKTLLPATIVALVVMACGESTPHTTTTAETPKEVSSTDSADAMKLAMQMIKSWKTLDQAILAAQPQMEDVSGADVSIGAAWLALWGVENLRWSELQGIQETKYGLVMKDSDAHRGKRLCVKGNVIEIALDRTVSDQKIFLGGMYSGAGNIYRFIAVQSTGEIMQDSPARFCGIVTGQQHYENSIGGVAHAVQLVGMFDLPENRMN